MKLRVGRLLSMQKAWELECEGMRGGRKRSGRGKEERRRRKDILNLGTISYHPLKKGIGLPLSDQHLWETKHCQVSLGLCLAV